MFATGPANNCFLDLFGPSGYGTISSLNGFENMRMIEVMLDCMFTGNNFAITTANVVVFGEANKFAFDYDFTGGATPTPLAGLSFKITRGSAKTATTHDSPTFGKRMTIWGRDDQETVKAYSNGQIGSTFVTYTPTEASVAISDPNTLTLGLSGLNATYMKVYEAAIRVNGTLVFHIRPKLWMQTSATPGTIPDLSRYGNDLTISGLLDQDYRYGEAWSKQMPYSGKESVG